MITDNLIKHGTYWDKSVNVVYGIPCECEVGDRCWAKSMAKMYRQLTAPKIEFRPDALKKIKTTGEPHVWAVNWLGDIGHESVPKEHVQYIFDYILHENILRKEPHQFLILTKWPDNLYNMLYGPTSDYFFGGNDYVPNIYVGISVTDQPTFNERIGGLLKFAEAGFKTWISYEPARGPIDFHFDDWGKETNGPAGWQPLPLPAQVIAGCDTSNRADRWKADPQWFLDVAEQCEKANVPFFLKQADIQYINGKRTRVRSIGGREWNELDWRM